MNETQAAETPLAPRLRGKVALVTGSARGLGRGIALRLARLGADVAITDLNLAGAAGFGEELTAATVMDECRAQGVRSVGVEADLSVREAVDDLVARVVAELGSVDILVNCAGGLLVPIERSLASSMPEEDLRRILDINLMSAVFCSQAAAAVMKPRGWGRIVSISSHVGIRPVAARAAHYAMAKGAVVTFTRALAHELGPHGICVNAIAPTYVKTSRAMASFPEREALAASVPLRRLAEVEDIAKVVEFFCTDLSDYVTGQCLAVCGGAMLFPS
ncbi:MAG: SDR family oxidoreductase [Armatimonadetes bacterium]|nr:SDR family oxidoreductase [Armatimonadota bacterium]